MIEMRNKMFKIEDRYIGKGHPAYIIAEMSANHAGSLENAKKIIRAAKDAGADCIKLQTYTADTLTIDCDNEYFHIEKGTWSGEKLYDLYKRAYTPWEWHQELKEEADAVGIDFFSTPFDKTAVDFLEQLNVGFYKVASFEMVDIPLLKCIARTGKPIIMSTGMSTLEEIEDAVNAIREEGNNQIALLKCSSAYPAIPKDMNLATIPDMQKRFSVPVGLSDHSMGSLGAVAAVAMGANIIEKHFCLNREIDSADASFSMTADEFAEMVQSIRTVERAMGKVCYEPSETEKASMIFRRSLFAVETIEKGQTITEENVRSIRPGYGIKPKFYANIQGMTAKETIERGTPIQFKKLEKIKYIFLTNNNNTQSMFEWLREKEGKSAVLKYSDALTVSFLEEVKPDYIISYNYRHIIPKEVIEYMQGHIINLHIALLPYNRGSSPNFFSFICNTPKGVTIHKVDEKLDNGDIYCKQEVMFEEQQETFESSYQKLQEAMMELFAKNWDDIKNGKLVGKKQEGQSSYHNSKELEALRLLCNFDWKDNIAEYKKKLKARLCEYDKGE